MSLTPNQKICKLIDKKPEANCVEYNTGYSNTKNDKHHPIHPMVNTKSFKGWAWSWFYKKKYTSNNNC